MQFMTTLFGGNTATILNTVFALGIVLVSIVLVLWLLKLVMNRSQGLGAARRQRLAIVESAVVDGKRRLLIIRRDDVEHVILTGGPQDVIVESGIPAPRPAAMPRRAQRPAPQPATAPQQAAEPVPTDNSRVPREAVDKLHDLARPAPLKPRAPTPSETLRRTAALRPITGESTPLIPSGPTLRVDNSAEPPDDSANTGDDGSSGAHGGSGGRRWRFSRTGRSDA